MNSEIDLTQLGSSGNSAGAAMQPVLAAPPRRFVTRYGVPIALLAAFGALGAYAFREAFTPSVSVEVVQPVMVAPASAPGAAPASAGAPGKALFEAPGWVEPAPFETLISSQVMGVVEKLHVLEGQRVTTGMVVAELNSVEAKWHLEAARAELDLRTAELEAARDHWENPTDLRESVDVLAARLAELQSERERMVSMTRIARRQAEIDLSLSKTGAGGEFPAEKAALEAKASDLGIASLDAQIRSTSAGLLAARERMDLRIADRNRVKLAEAEVARAKAALADAEYKLSQRTILSPREGIVMRLYTSEGASMMPDIEHGMHIISVYEPTQLQVRADVPLADAGMVKDGLRAEISVESAPGRTFAGRLDRIVHSADIQKNTLPVKVAITGPDPVLKPEMLVRVAFFADERAAVPGTTAAPSTGTATMAGSAVGIPEAALEHAAEGRAHLWLVRPDSTAARREVTVGAAGADGIVPVLSGLSLADKVIVSAPPSLSEGKRVQLNQGEAH